jgi:asparagine synthase (glutamine-hydrolysing)
MEMHVTAQKMATALAHRGPDAADVWQDPDHPVALSHRRLSIIDLSPLGAQPMASHSGRYVIVYNGEFYNYLSLQKELEVAGHTFKGRSDTEVFLTAIEAWGLNRALQKINGMFAFTLWDRQEKELHFARDRLGKKPLYIGWSDSSKKAQLVFGSELKALRAHAAFQAEMNSQSVAHFMQRGWIEAPHCIYKNVWMLRPAHRITVAVDKFEAGTDLAALMQPYWHPLEIAEQRYNQGKSKSEHAMLDQFEDTLRLCVADRMISDVPLGAFLSGGIDSSAVAAMMQSLSSRPVKTYTIGFEEKGFNEAEHAKAIAIHLGTEHTEHTLSPREALEIIPQMPDMFDEPFADISAIPTYLVSKFARQSVTVALTGDGGDEMLGGYARHIQGPKLWKRMSLMPRILRAPLAKALRSVPVSRWDAINPAHPQFGSKIHKSGEILALDSEEDIYQRLLSISDEPAFLTPQNLIALPEISNQFSFAERMILWDTLTYLPGDVLTKVDRASMAASLEARAPLLDSRIFDYVWTLPENMKIRAGSGKYLLREYLARHVPRKLFERPKQGFNMPIGEWLRGPLKHWAEILLDERTLKNQGMLDERAIRNIWYAHLDGQGNHAGSLWSVLMFQAWHKRWM